MSISLWDLHELVGLPMAGCLYDKVVPSALELTGVDEKRDRFIPHSKKKTVRPKSTHNPLGDIAIHERWSTAEEALFAKLSIERCLKEEVYLAAYLACWLCVFVLPSKDVNSIRPSTFKMLSLVANGRRVNLAIPVLASIYEGLNTIATSPKPPDGPFKFVDDGHAEELDHSYFIAIRSSYLTLRQGDRFIIEPYSPHRFGCRFGCQFGYYQDVPGTLRYDTRVASLEEGLRYWSLCVLSKSSSKAWFLFLPANAKKLCSEAYKARWAKDEDKQVDGGENDPPHALIPPVVIECDSQVAVAEASKGKYSSHNVADSDSSNKDRHWKRQRKEVTPLKATETNENASRSSLANFVAELEDEVQTIDIGEESETSHLSTLTPPLGMEFRRKQSPPPAAVSVFKGERFLFNYQKEFLQWLWSGLLAKISNTSVHFLSSIEDDVYLILESMKSFQKFDVSKVEESLNMLFAKVHAYDEVRSLSFEKFSRSLHEQQLKKLRLTFKMFKVKQAMKPLRSNLVRTSWSILRKIL
ncbi:hypothetical protein Sango_2691000 [Sesamum angolense]|uniref:Aminotransferase-like plant mobile domain-containing protein n=1 Tax=Sesamum angolense TaxID=2727404 RepID=A0AAE2BHM9_9LAMI|nr:hypothetical protein Sango_2691000 [Sesamum angolense]